MISKVIVLHWSSNRCKDLIFAIFRITEEQYLVTDGIA